ncbi:SIMPL domain-containing protein [Salinarimonas sp.]|uniref:SIMPL domain-containing protein n=1 Tax=Salinarimonas sp. TaxID=2766526 RepID=UPI0032D8F1C1
MRFITLPALAALVAASLALAPLAGPARAQDATAPGRIAVTGMGEVERAPDFARVFVSVTNRGETVAAVVEANRVATEEALAAIEARGVAREDVLTANFQVYETPQEFDRDGEPRAVPPYTATHQLQIVLREIDAVGAFAGEILALDAMTFQSIAWGLERSEEAEEEAMRRAVADARRQAEVLADAAGVPLGAIRRIGDGSVDGGPRPEMDRMMMRAAAAPAVPIVPPAQLTFTARVGMEWTIGE